MCASALALSLGFSTLVGACGRDYIGLVLGPGDRTLNLTHKYNTNVNYVVQLLYRDFKLFDPSALT